ncbi:MAG: TIGR00730 family Rossman fold protein [Candidatus Omnitrophica bacterium]|nr:TIGR00730 family Rossman fold protein [Candidatus Omnitrophota bacterium]
MSAERRSCEYLVKAYKNADFLTSPAARLIRVMSELEEPKARFYKHHVHNTVVFFGSARTIPRKEALSRFNKVEQKMRKVEKPSKKLQAEFQKAEKVLLMSRYYEDALELSEKLTRWFIGLKGRSKNFMVCSGGGPGIMEAANRGAKKAGGRSVGLNISLPLEQSPNKYQTKELAFEFHYFFIRKFWFVYLAKALVIFPGGYGTFDELFELLTLMQTRKTKKKMPVVLYGSEYWEDVVNFQGLLNWGMIDEEDLSLFRIIDDVDEALRYMQEELTQRYKL